MMQALLGLGDMTTNVNIPNRGQIPNLPLGAIVETNALFRRDSIAPVYAGEMDPDILALTMRHVINQRNTLRVARTCDWQLGVTTFLDDPLMARVNYREGAALLEEMLAAQRAYLPVDWWKNRPDHRY